MDKEKPTIFRLKAKYSGLHICIKLKFPYRNAINKASSLFFFLYSLKESDNMKESNVLLDKSLKFAARIVRLYQYLTKEKKESVISKQIIRSGTSIGANANEAVYGVSKAEFIAKLQISLKETAETEYWLRLLVMSEYLTEIEGQSLIADCLEIKRILVATLNTAKSK